MHCDEYDQGNDDDDDNKVPKLAVTSITLNTTWSNFNV